MRRNKTVLAFWGAILFAITFAIVVMTAVLVYDRVSEYGIGDDKVAIVMLLVIVFLALVCTVFDIIRRRIMIDTPVSKILVATDKIAAGDFSYRTEISHPYGKYNEYDVIMDNINTMAAELEKSELLKTDFISNVSHELKTPLAVIQSYATLLANDGISDDERKKYANTIRSASARLSSLIQNILKLNKLENGDIRPELENFNLTESLAESVLAFENIIEEKEIELDCDLDDIIVCSSQSYLEIVWNNLISNAIKFTEHGGRVGVSLKRDKNRVIVKISDTGCGISPEIGARIFEKFYQGDTSHKEEGNGLGLALVKKVIDTLGGEISVFSEPEKGTTFSVALKGIDNE